MQLVQIEHHIRVLHHVSCRHVIVLMDKVDLLPALPISPLLPNKGALLQQILLLLLVQDTPQRHIIPILTDHALILDKILIPKIDALIFNQPGWRKTLIVSVMLPT